MAKFREEWNRVWTGPMCFFAGLITGVYVGATMMAFVIHFSRIK